MFTKHEGPGKSSWTLQGNLRVEHVAQSSRISYAEAHSFEQMICLQIFSFFFSFFFFSFNASNDCNQEKETKLAVCPFGYQT